MFKSLLFPASLLVCGLAEGGILLGIPKQQTKSAYPVQDEKIFCADKSKRETCFPIILREGAPYARTLEIWLTDTQANNLLNNMYGFDMPDPITFYRVDAAEYARVMNGAEMLPPASWTGPETDPKVGYNLLYCGGALMACGGTIFGMMSGSVEALFGFTGGCLDVQEKCTAFLDGWRKERAYYTELQKYYRSQGYGPSGGNAGGSGVASGQGGSGPGDLGTTEPVFTTCVGNTVSMGGGPKGAWLEESAVDCYPM